MGLLHSVLRFGALALTAGLVSCGGSSSETPLPLPPHPLHTPYRTRPVVARAAPKDEPVEPRREPTPPPPSAPELRPGGPARSTWGTSNTK